MFVANANAVKNCHTIISGAKIGCMLSLSNVYPNTCKPDVIFLVILGGDLLISSVLKLAKWKNVMDWFTLIKTMKEMGLLIEKESFFWLL